MSKNQPQPEKEPAAKIGAGHAKAMGRLGFKEIAQILPATSESIKPIEEIGLFGNVTPQEALDQKQPHEPTQDMEMTM